MILYVYLLYYNHVPNILMTYVNNCVKLYTSGRGCASVPHVDKRALSRGHFNVSLIVCILWLSIVCHYYYTMSGSKIIDLPFLQSMIDKTEPGVRIVSYEVSAVWIIVCMIYLMISKLVEKILKRKKNANTWPHFDRYW